RPGAGNLPGRAQRLEPGLPGRLAGAAAARRRRAGLAQATALMRRKARQRGIVLAAALVLVALAAVQYAHDRRQATGTLLARDPATIARVTLALPGQPPENYR